MRIGILMVGAALAARAGWAGLPAVAAVPAEVAGHGALSVAAVRVSGDVAAWGPVEAAEGVGLTVAAFGALAGVETGVGEAAPAYGALAGTAAVERDAPVCTALPLTLGVGAGGPAYPTLAGMTLLDVDPFLASVDFWRGGPLGELRKAAGKGPAGDAAAAEYWKRVNWAIERRDALGSRSKRVTVRQ